jgi:hypothetical protein
VLGEKPGAIETVQNDRKKKRKGGGSVRLHNYYYYYYYKENRKSATPSFPRQYPPILLEKVCCRPNIVLGSEDEKVMGGGLLGGESLSIGAGFCVWWAAVC